MREASAGQDAYDRNPYDLRILPSISLSVNTDIVNFIFEPGIGYRVEDDGIKGSELVHSIYQKFYSLSKNTILNLSYLWGLAPTPPVLLLTQRTKKTAFFTQILFFTSHFKQNLIIFYTINKQKLHLQKSKN